MAAPSVLVLLLVDRNQPQEPLRRLLITAGLRSDIDVILLDGDQPHTNSGTYLVVQLKDKVANAIAVVNNEAEPPVPLQINVNNEHVIRTLIKILVRLAEANQRREVHWQRSSEDLIRWLGILLDQRDELSRAYFEVFGNWRAAEAKVTILEAQLTALQAERNDTPEESRSPKVILGIAMTVIAALGTIGGAVGSEAVKKPAQKVIEQAAKVHNDCNVVINVQSPTQGTTVTAGAATIQAKAQVASTNPPNQH